MVKFFDVRAKNEEIREFVENITKLRTKQGREPANSILEVVTKTNWQVIEEMKGDGNAVKSTKDSMALVTYENI